MRSRSKFLEVLEGVLGIDLRSLALFRVALGIFILTDLAVRATDLAVFYTDSGVLPRGPLIDHFKSFWNFSVPLIDFSYNVSIHLASGSVWFQAVLFLAAACFALMLTVGFRTRLAVCVSWFLLVSLQIRDPLVIQGGDVLLRMLLFWSMFLPLGARYSLDSALRPSSEIVPPRVLSIGTAALLIQIAFVYWFTAIVKLGPVSKPIWWDQGTAVYYALSLDQFTKPLGHFLYQFPGLMKFLNYATILSEIAGPFLLFIPFWNGRIRTLAAFLFIGMHMGFFACMTLGPFPWVGSLAMFVFLPSGFWDRILRRYERFSPGPLKVYYDGQCGSCGKAVHIFRAFFLLPGTELVPAQEDPEVYREMENHNSWIVRGPEGKYHFGFDAFCAACETSPLLRFFVPIFRWGPLTVVGDLFYKLIAGNRAIGSALTVSIGYRPLRIKSSLIGNAAALFFLAYITLWNYEAVRPSFRFPGGWEKIGTFLQLTQYWNMFSPPLREDGWFVMPGLLRNGKEVDLFHRGEPIEWKKPKEVYKIYKNERWRKYLSILYSGTGTDQRLYFGQYMCRDWNSRHPGLEQLEELEIYFIQEMSLPDYAVSPPVRQMLWKHYCFKVPDKITTRWS